MRLIRTKYYLATLFVLASMLVVFESKAIAEPWTTPVEVASVSGGPIVKGVNFQGLQSSLRKTDAIGFTTKIWLKHELDSLLVSFGEYHKGQGEHTLSTLRHQFSELLASTLSLLQEGDPQLFSKLWNAQGSLWLVVSDPVSFQAAVGNDTESQAMARRVN